MRDNNLDQTQKIYHQEKKIYLVPFRCVSTYLYIMHHEPFRAGESRRNSKEEPVCQVLIYFH